MHELSQKKQVMEKRKNQELYREELTKLSEMKNAGANCDKQNIDFERGKLRNQWDLQNRIQTHLKTEETNNLKSMLNDTYQQQINFHKQAKMTEEETKRHNEKMQIEKNLKIMNIDKIKQEEKRQEYSMARLQDLSLKNQKKENETTIYQTNVEESKKLMNDYSMKELKNEQQYKDKFSNINQHMKRNLDTYTNNVLSEDRKRQMSEETRQKIYIDRYKQRLEQDHLKKLNWQNSQKQDMTKSLTTQIHESLNSKMLNSQISDIESKLVREKQFQIDSIENQIRNDKKKRQQVYKDLLASQIDFNNKIKLNGNMTKVEKAFNKTDLKAYKSYDKNVYSMIPGINNNNHEPKSSLSLKPGSKKMERGEREDKRRLESFGYSRGFVVPGNTMHKHNNSISILPGSDNFNPITHKDVNQTFDMSSPNKTHSNRAAIIGNASPYLGLHNGKL
jgi:hypothetical protein